MRKTFYYAGLLGFIFHSATHAQVDTTFIYSNNKPYGSLDLRIAKTPDNFYYLQEGKTFSFRESPPGVRTGTYLDMTSWDSSPYTEGNLREKSGASDIFVMNYRLLLPEGYNDSYDPGYPIIVIFHGLGESGNCWDDNCYHASQSYSPVSNDPPAPTSADHELLNNDHQLSNGGAAHLVARNAADSKLPDDPALKTNAFPGFVLVPQNLKGWDIVSAQDAIRIVRLITKKYNIDEDRIYIHGLSNGGQGVYEAIKRAPWMFAAALTMSAIGDANINAQQVASYISHIPLWVFQGGQDTNPWPAKTENFVKLFRDAGTSVRYTKYPDLGHGTWSTAYKEPDFFTWILDKNRSDIHPFAGNPVICSDEGLQLQMPAGFFAYQWQLNGQVIAGADESILIATSPGTYKARFSRVRDPQASDWNQWSQPLEVTAGEGLPQAQMEQIGTVLLRDLNDFPDARLRSAGEFSHYYWYKNGNLIDFPGDQDDTLRNVTISPSMGNGVYTLATANFGNCISPQSEGKHVYFNNQAPVNLVAPTNLAGDVDGPVVTLTWTDAASGEDGYEIWRRRRIDASTLAPWEMAVLTGPGATRFEDTALYPSSQYEYKIRAVSANGRSAYHPSAQGLKLTTGEDTEAPAAPVGLAVRRTGVQRIELSWSPSSDNTALRDYIINYGSESFSTNAIDTVFIMTNAPLNSVFEIFVTARDVAGNVSEQSNRKTISTYMSGLFYEHNTGFITDLDSIAWGTPEFTGMVQTFSLGQKTQEDYFNFRFDGFLYITVPGSYQFRISSDDGSRLRLNSRLIIDNDGIHGLVTKTSSNQSLAAGAQRIMVDFFDYIESDTLGVQYKGPDTNNEWSALDVEVLKSDESVVTSIGDVLQGEHLTLSVYPNPAHQNNINITVGSSGRSPVRVQLMDPRGRQILSEVFELESLSQGVRLAPAGTLSEGMYFVVATQGKYTTRKRLIIRAD